MVRFYHLFPPLGVNGRREEAYHPGPASPPGAAMLTFEDLPNDTCFETVPNINSFGVNAGGTHMYCLNAENLCGVAARFIAATLVAAQYPS
jgi:hypothetical protein